MAKSARASSRKAAKTRLRNTVYAPAEQARLERLSQKLRETINASSTTGDMEVDREDTNARDGSLPSSNENETSMLNAQDAKTSPSTNITRTSATSSSSSRKRKPIVSKSRKALVFSGVSKKKKGSKATKKGGRR